MPHYSRAPITEVVIDLKVQWPDEAPADVFDALAKALASRFPRPVRPIRTVQMGYAAPADAVTEGQFLTSQDVVGVRIENDARVLQLQRASFTYSHLPPYTAWTGFCPEARELWEQFIQATGVQVVTRAAVRVINKLTLKGSPSDSAIYTNLIPKLPPIFASPAQTYFMQLQVPLSKKLVEGGRAIVNSGATPTSPDAFELMLDFDLFVDAPLEAKSDAIWALLGHLSDAKNALFEECITDETRKLIA